MNESIKHYRISNTDVLSYTDTLGTLREMNCYFDSYDAVKLARWSATKGVLKESAFDTDVENPDNPVIICHLVIEGTEYDQIICNISCHSTVAVDSQGFEVSFLYEEVEA